MDKSTNKQQDKHVGLYDSFVAKAHEVFVDGRDKTREAMQSAIEKAREQMTTLGELSSEQGKQFQRYMQRDLEQIARYFRDVGEEAKDQLQPARMGAGALALGSAAGVKTLSARRKPNADYFYDSEN